MSFSNFFIFTAKVRADLAQAQNENKIESVDIHFNLPYEGELDGTPEDIAEIYKHSNGSEITWWADEEKGIGGKIHFLPFEYAFEHVEDTSEVFREIETGCEHYTNGVWEIDGKVGVYMFENNVTDHVSLGLDFSGYLKLLEITRGFNYWQKVIQDIDSGQESQELIAFREQMPLIFSDFKWDAFVDLYNSVKIQ